MIRIALSMLGGASQHISGLAAVSLQGNPTGAPAGQRLAPFGSTLAVRDEG